MDKPRAVDDMIWLYDFAGTLFVPFSLAARALDIGRDGQICTLFPRLHETVQWLLEGSSQLMMDPQLDASV